MDNETTNSDLLQEDYMNKQARIARLEHILADLHTFSKGTEGGETADLEKAESYIEIAIGILEDEL